MKKIPKLPKIPKGQQQGQPGSKKNYEVERNLHGKVCNHPQSSTQSLNHPQPPKSYPRKPELVTISHANTETSVDFESDM